MKPIKNHALIVYDGDCAFCSRSMAWIARHDVHDHVRFTPCTSKTGGDLVRLHRIDPDEPSTFLLILEGRHYVRSDALLRICRLLDGKGRALRVLGLVPTSIRDRVYDVVARNRRRMPACTCPTPPVEMRARTIA